MSDYKLDPLKHGFEPISQLPELNYMFPTLDHKYFVKVVAYDNFGGLVYWYTVINLYGHDDRIEISSSTYDSRKPATYEKQNGLTTDYRGLITSDEFAKSLLEHLLGATLNRNFKETGPVRYLENLGPKMRKEFNYATEQV